VPRVCALYRHPVKGFTPESCESLTILPEGRVAGAIAGVNAAVVGLLGAALYDPVWTSAVRGPLDLAIGLVGFALLVAWRAQPLVVVLWCIAASVAAALVL
jgi:chromate transporter